MGNTSSKEEVTFDRKLGEGSYAEVYKAVWRKTPVAAKKLHTHWLEKSNVKAQFKAEWELLSRLDHPNIVKYLSVVLPKSPQEAPIIITELLEQDLAKFISSQRNRNCKVSFCDTVFIMLDVAKGLDYLHQGPEPVVHRDLACKNILLTANKQAKIADFGIARCFPGGEMAATANMGTIATRAPETYGKWSYSREHKNYGTKADIFSFGVVLLEVIVGHLSVPLSELRTEDGKIVPETIRRSEDLYELQPEHPLRPLVLVCLEDEPKDRPTAEYLVNTLTDFKISNELHRSQENLKSKKSVHLVTSGQYDYEFKVVLVGDTSVGKTSIATKFVQPSRPFQDNLPATIPGGEYNERLQLKGKSIFLQIVDTAGDFNRTSSLPQLYRGVHGAAVVFDVASKASLASVRQWVSMVRKKCGKDIPIILVGNKTDCESRQVSIETAEKTCKDFNLFYIEVSAKTGLNIEETFSVLIEQLMDQREQQDFPRPSTSSAPHQRRVDFSANQYAPFSQITKRESVRRRRINKDPDSLSLNSDIHKERNPRTPLLGGEAGRKKKSCCS